MMRGIVLVRDCVACPRCLLSACLPSVLAPFSLSVVLLCSFCPRPVLLPVSRPGLPVLSCSFAYFVITLPSLMPGGRYSFEMMGETHGTRRGTRRFMMGMG